MTPKTQLRVRLDTSARDKAASFSLRNIGPHEIDSCRTILGAVVPHKCIQMDRAASNVPVGEDVPSEEQSRFYSTSLPYWTISEALA